MRPFYVIKRQYSNTHRTRTQRTEEDGKKREETEATQTQLSTICA